MPVLADTRTSVNSRISTHPFWSEYAIDFVHQGLLHLWTGTTHLIFFVLVLLTLNLTRYKARWKPGLCPASLIKGALTTIFAFTAAHAVTLLMFAAGWRPESEFWLAIATTLTIVVVAANNLWPMHHHMGISTFGFGVLHAISFVYYGQIMPDPLYASTSQAVLGTLAFCVGLLTGLMLICALVIPALLLLGNNRWYANTMMPVTSALLMLVAVGMAYLQW